MAKIMSLLRAAILAFGLGSVAFASPAQAEWESVYSAAGISTQRSCRVDQNQGDALIRNTPGRRLRIAGGARVFFEIYGHGIDNKSPDRLSNSSLGDPTIYQRTTGSVNARNRCGAIGSVRVDFQPRTVTRDTNVDLLIGDERIALTIIARDQFARFGWLDESVSRGVVPAGSRPAIPLPPAAPSPTVRVDRADCDPGAAGACAPATGVIVIGGVDAGRSNGRRVFADSLSKCIAPQGGRTELSDDSLTITLPDQRLGAVANCWSKYSPARAVVLLDRPDLGGESPSGVTALVAGGDRDLRTRIDSNDDEVVLAFVDTDLLRNMTGSRRFQIVASSLANQRKSLFLTVQSEIPFGVERIELPVNLNPPARPAVGRLQARGAQPPTINPRIILTNAGEARQQFAWKIFAAQTGNPPANRCFAEIDGLVSPNVGATNISVALRPAANATCSGKRYRFSAAPAGRDGVALYTKSIDLTLP
ncbi:MAG: hypothetical protein WAT93_11190 [Pontixanthobacter sp.]